MSRRLRRFAFAVVAVSASLTVYVREARAEVLEICLWQCALAPCVNCPGCLCMDKLAACLADCIDDTCDFFPEDPTCEQVPGT